MNRRAYSVIEVLIAMAIFLFGIFPIIGFTFTSLRGERIAGSKEEAARLTTTVVDYIKSRGYDEVKTTIGGGFNETYKLVLKDDGSAFITENYKFEKDFYGITTPTTADNIFILNSRGLRMDDGKAQFTVYMTLADVELMRLKNSSGDDDPETGWEEEDKYENPITGKTGDNVLFGTGGINTDETSGSDNLSRDKFILGKVVFEYTQNSDGVFDKDVEMQFLISPIEEWR
ncbi:hypothetical protein [uncultured Ilyobacter sp.]|uniref:type IV pilus modification PilV family protein n=1 Tax=uncultured Ilyobacter sp. TaxID=544433 RepID=UPI0029F4F007|nr:hypothetical protein [uncultured Ilyobacter sp.]